MEKWKINSIVIGGIIGAFLGTTAAFLFVRSASRLGQKPKISTNQGVKVGMGLVNLLRQFSDLGSGK